MMKHMLTGLLAWLFFVPCSAQEKFTIKGKLDKSSAPFTVMLSYRTEDKSVVDSAVSKNGKFTFTGNVEYPLKATLSVKRPNDPPRSMLNRGDEQTFFLENTKITVSGKDKINTAVIKAGAAQQDYEVLRSELKPLEEKMAPLSKKMGEYFENNDEKAREELFPKLRAIRMDMTAVEDNFMRTHPDSYVSLDLLANKSGVINPVAFEPQYNTLSDRIRNSKGGQIWGQRLALVKKIAIGQTFSDFTLPDTAGNMVSLSSKRGKYILLDFWASWCGPCRAENPHVLKAYNRFKDRNFDVLAVSLDNNRKSWIKAIIEDGMPWTHISDLKAYKSPVILEYDIRAIPQNFLLDPEGRIVASNLRGEALEKKLEEILGAQSQGIAFTEAPWKDVLAKAKKENKLVFVDVYTTWCGPCKKMAKEVFPLKEVGDAFNPSFVSAKIDAEKGEGKDIAKKFGVVSFPTYLFLNGDGELVYRVGGYNEPKTFIQYANVAIKEKNDPKPFAVWEAEYEGGNRSKDFLLGYLKKRKMTEQPSAEIIEEVFPLLTAEDLKNEEVINTLLYYSPKIQYVPGGKFSDYVLKNYKSTDGMVKETAPLSVSTLLLQSGVRNYFINNIVPNNRENMLPVLEKTERAIWKIIGGDADEPVKRYRMTYYQRTNNEKKLIPVVKDYVTTLLKGVDTLRAADAKNFKKFMEPYLSGEKDSTEQGWSLSKRREKNQLMIDPSYKLRSAAEAVYEAVNNKQMINEAITWAEKANTYFPHFSSEAVYAALLYKSGQQEKAAQAMLSASKDSFLNADLRQLLLDNVEKINKGEKLTELWHR